MEWLKLLPRRRILAQEVEAGGFRETKSPATTYTASPLDGNATPGNSITVAETGYPITVGGGGAATPLAPSVEE